MSCFILGAPSSEGSALALLNMALKGNILEKQHIFHEIVWASKENCDFLRLSTSQNLS